MSESQARPRRRGFMLGAAAATAATAAVVTLPTQPAAPTTEPEPPKPDKGGGYRISEHIRQYYRTTLV